jgi:hypothetical protein
MFWRHAKSLTCLPSSFTIASVLKVVGTSRLCTLITVLFFAGLAHGQTNPGMPSFSAFDSHAVDTINLQNLNISMNIPVYQKSGAFPFQYELNANSYIEVSSTGTSLAPGFSLSGVLVGVAAATYTQSTTLTCNGATTYVRIGWQIKTADGTIHPVPGFSDTKGCINPGFTNLATDGSGYTLTVNLGEVVSIYNSAGDSVYANAYGSSITDSNGNTITGSGTTFTDTLGVNPTFSTGAQGSPYTWTDVSNNSQSVTVNNTTGLTLKSAFGCGSGQYSDYNIPSSSLQTSISFPDGATMGIAYEKTPGGSSGQYTGRLGQITLRTGGTITYTYGGTNNGINCSSLSPPTLTRKTSDGTTTYTWVLNNLGSGNYGNTTTVVDNGGNATVYTFTGVIPVGTIDPPPMVQALTEVQHYQGAVSPGNLLTTDIYCYQGSSGQPGNCSTAIITPPVKELDVYHTINGMSNSSRTQTKYDAYGNVTYSAQYDFGATTPTVATTATYGTWNGANCVAVSTTVNNKPCDVLTQQNGSNVAESRFTYSPQGNLLTTYKWTGSSWLSNTTQNQYNSNGTALVSYDLANKPTTYTYNAGSYNCGTIGCTQYPFPTSIAKGGLTTSSTWYGIGGAKHTDTDASGNTTTFGYVSCSTGAADPFWRVASVTDPMGNEVCKTYPSGSSPDTANSSFTFNSGNSIQNITTTTDGYGRTINKQTQQGPTNGNYDTVSTQYGWSGNYKSVAATLPCPTSLSSECSFNSATSTSLVDPLGRPHTVTDGGSPTPGVTTNTYLQNDVLSVLSPAPSGENTKRRQKEYDGLGRLKSSCGIMSTGGYSSCSQSTGSYSGVFTAYSYSAATGSTTVTATRGVQTRSKTFDGLGRVTSSTTPEGGTNTYVYDVAGCYNVNYPGHLTAAGAANGNGYCYAYDALGRMTLAYGLAPSGAKYCRRFYYDNSTGYSGTIPSGITISNSLGRMVEAATDSCSAGTLITDEWFSYDIDGHMTDMWELTPHSGRYYHSTATFYGNGAVDVLTLANPSLYTFTYGLDGEGRLNTATSGSTNIVTGTTYNAASQPTVINLQGTDNDTYTYDSNTGRMTNWDFTVSGRSETGALTWNPNSTLEKLQIVDGFNSAGSQTCNFNPSLATGTGYDDMGRLVGVDCGSGGWGQTFGYDQYDNLNKAVISGRIGTTWATTYYSANNHYSPSTTYTYDGSGNITNDSFNTYTWDQFGKMLTANSTSIVYDALGRAVEIASGSSGTEIWYTQLGKTAYMFGGTINYAYWPTPGGGTLLETGNSGSDYYLHKDWLGNARISTSVAGHALVADNAFSPYGETYNVLDSTNQNQQMFTGLTQDVLSGMWDTPNR